MSTKILVCGGAGYVGSALVPVLQDHGYDVTVIDLMWFGNHLPKDTRIIQKDIFDCTERDLEGFDVCLNLSGISNDPGAEFDPIRNFVYNAALSPYLALIAKRARVPKFIQASTCSVYGYTVNELYDETSTIQCNYPYGVSKFAAEQGIMHLCDENFSTICLRKGTISGYAPRMRMDLIVNTMTLHALMSGVITVNNPAIWRPILSVKDAVSAYLRAIQSHEKLSGIFNIAEDNYTVGEVADIVKECVEEFTSKKVTIDIKNVQDVRNYKVSIEKAKTILGFHPRHTVYDMTKDVLNNWGSIKDNIHDHEYFNIEVCRDIFKEKLKFS